MGLAGINAALREVTRKFLREEAVRIITQPEPWFVRLYREQGERERAASDLQRWTDDGGGI